MNEPVVLRTLIKADGTVGVVGLISGNLHLAKAAMDAVRQWRFKPYVRDGRAVDVQTQITVDFP